MKKLIVLAVLLAAATSFATGVMKNDMNGRTLRGIAPVAYGTYSSTKANITLSTATLAAVRVQPTAAVTVRVNGAGASWPIAANAVQEYHIPAGVTSMVFSVTSSATKTKLHYQSEY